MIPAGRFCIICHAPLLPWNRKHKQKKFCSECRHVAELQRHQRNYKKYCEVVAKIKEYGQGLPMKMHQTNFMHLTEVKVNGQNRIKATIELENAMKRMQND
jgi:hypothetical protein